MDKPIFYTGLTEPQLIAIERDAHVLVDQGVGGFWGHSQQRAVMTLLLLEIIHRLELLPHHQDNGHG